MALSLATFRSDFSDRLLNLLWRQWTTVGVAGNVARLERLIIDPEALVLISCEVARRDPRLFDAMLDWLRINGRYVNVARLQRMLREHEYSAGAVLAAVAATTRTADSSAKWSRMATPKKRTGSPKPLFRLPNGTPLPVAREPDSVFLEHGFLREAYEQRDIARIFSPVPAANLLLRLRAFLGVNARCEILVHLLTHGSGSPRAIARASSYYPATVSKALAEMNDSGYIVSRFQGRQRFYSATSASLRDFFVGHEEPVWLGWGALMRALEITWLFLNASERDDETPLEQASGLRRLVKAAIADLLGAAGVDASLAGYERHAGDSLIPFFIERMTGVLNIIDRMETGK